MSQAREPSEPLLALLRTCSYHAEKMFKRHKNHDWVLFLAERADGTRQGFEVTNRAPMGPTDDQVLAALLDDARAEPEEIGGVQRLALGYVAHVTSKLQPRDPPIPEATTTRATVVVCEAHSATEHIAARREILAQHRTLGALGPIMQANTSLYGRLVSEEAAT